MVLEIDFSGEIGGGEFSGLNARPVVGQFQGIALLFTSNIGFKKGKLI